MIVQFLLIILACFASYFFYHNLDSQLYFANFVIMLLTTMLYAILNPLGKHKKDALSDKDEDIISEVKDSDFEVNIVHERDNSIEKKDLKETDNIKKMEKGAEWKKVRNRAIAVVSFVAIITATFAIGALWLVKEHASEKTERKNLEAEVMKKRQELMEEAELEASRKRAWQQITRYKEERRQEQVSREMRQLKQQVYENKMRSEGWTKQPGNAWTKPSN